MSAIKGLKPAIVWRYFEEISNIPRESKKEQQIIPYIIGLAEKFGLEYTIDHAGNILVLVPGNKGTRPVTLQAHMDMVCEKGKDSPHAFDRDPIRLVRDGKWIRADNTTLGADNGIGLACMLALMEERSLPHPDLELLFTVDEETGLTGIAAFDASILKAKTFINLDTEEDGTIYTGCAGGLDTQVRLGLDIIDPPQGNIPVQIHVHGLKGGHSGTSIHEGRGNAIKLLGRLLWNIMADNGLYLADLSGGSKHNAIPREALALVWVKKEGFNDLKKSIAEWKDIFSSELRETEAHLEIGVSVQAGTFPAINPSDALQIIDMIQAMPHGALVINTMPETRTITSSNLAACSINNGVLNLTTSQRSLYSSATRAVSGCIQSIARLAGAKTHEHHYYPAWTPKPDSAILQTCTRQFSACFGNAPRIRTIHAGLECALLGEKVPDMDMISIGPNIEQAHSPTERVEIDTVERFWILLLAILEDLGGR
ncbi:MAG: beta-Ala-His dipeptidase [Thermodesulfobacteriota bacterium]|nr:beta-Ala-His dipeptidase [Thermodesulfobacteriota bacterium]